MSRFVVVALSVTVLATCIVVHRTTRGRGVLLDPSVVDLRNNINEKEMLRVPLKLYNDSNHRAEVTGIRTSCGCTALLLDDGSPLAVGTVISAKATLLLEAQISTDSHPGLQSTMLIVNSVSRSGETTATARIGYRVRPAPTIIPSRFVWTDAQPAQSKSGEVTIFDSEVRPESQLVKHETSSASVRDIRIEPACPTPDNAIILNGEPLVARHVVRFTLTASSMVVDEHPHIKLFFDSPIYSTMTIPIDVIYRRPSFCLIPGELTLAPPFEDDRSVIVTCESSDSSTPRLTVLRCPDWCTVAITPGAGGISRILITRNAGRPVPRSSTILFGVSTEGHTHSMALPITYISGE